LIVVGSYLPGVKGGGHIRSIASLVHHLANHLDIFIVCQDRDAGDTTPYPQINSTRWVEVGNAHVRYLPPSQFTARLYMELITELRPDVLYLNTVFSVREVILPVLITMWKDPAVRIVAAPRGSLDPGALSLKRMKKQWFLRLLRMSHIPRTITWQASTEKEAVAISNALGTVHTVVASNFPSPSPNPPAEPVKKEPGVLRIVFLSRISPKKNLSYLIERLTRVRGELHLTIAGPIDDRHYWERCRSLIASLQTVRVTQVGTVPHEQVQEFMALHHIFALPTLGENFGHAILEALSAGVGVLISDQTPWQGLEARGAGWNLPLDDPGAWEAVLQQCCDMTDREFQTMRIAAQATRNDFVDIPSITTANLALFGCPPPSLGMK